MIAGSAVGGGLTALTMGLFRRNSGAGEFPNITKTEEVHDGDEHNRSETAEGGIG
jgi:hypothetical protein